MAQIRVFHSIEFINISLFERHLVSRERLQGKYSSLVGWLNNFLFFLFLAPYLYSTLHPPGFINRANYCCWWSVS